MSTVWVDMESLSLILKSEQPERELPGIELIKNQQTADVIRFDELFGPYPNEKGTGISGAFRVIAQHILKA